MQKVVGSNPISRSQEKAPLRPGFSYGWQGWPRAESRVGSTSRSTARRSVGTLLDPERVADRIQLETEQGLEAAGTLDLSTELGKRTYQLIKNGTLSWSIGFVVPEGGRRRRGNVTELTEVDLAEVSVVTTRANTGAHTLSIESAQVELVSSRLRDDPWPTPAARRLRGPRRQLEKRPVGRLCRGRSSTHWRNASSPPLRCSFPCRSFR